MNKIFAHGRRSSIFEGQKGTVIKLYDKDFSKTKIDEEYRKTLHVWETKQLNVAKPIKLVTKNGQNGLVLEKIDGTSLMDLFQKKPWLFFASSSKIVAVHKKIHQVKSVNLPTQREIFYPLIKSSTRLPESDKDRLLQVLCKSHEPVLCHGDFHHGNLMQTNSGQIYILDWMDAFIGAYQLDVALTAVNAVVSTAPNHIPYFYRQVYEFLKSFLKLDKKYLETYSVKKAEEYMFLAAAIHLARYKGSDTAVHQRHYEKLKKAPNIDISI